ncbi:PCNA-interacting partner isoform X24 [Balaenoptera ricei]|uniref:PCNA-interacting partner isoform X24 n=1 Tax=Balaenoptera ricei TaxID=2746895 RepID=UPI0028BDD0F9|nr:PCNA-interacting partner isoform X24 [Balaenoptera ricei]
MAVLNRKSVLDMIKEFRRNWHTFCNSERTTVCGADSMLLALQLSMAENNKQVATSFIRTIELGGKGYAPSPSDPLRTHIKGLSNFINFIDKLDEILGEIPNPRRCKFICWKTNNWNKFWKCSSGQK